MCVQAIFMAAALNILGTQSLSYQPYSPVCFVASNDAEGTGSFSTKYAHIVN